MFSSSQSFKTAKLAKTSGYPSPQLEELDEMMLDFDQILN